MAQGPSVEELLKRNAQRAEHHEPIQTLSELSQLQVSEQVPMPKIFIVTCCDPRIDAWKIFGLEKWDATVVRSCAGRVTPQLQNMIFLDHVLQLSDVMIIHHTDCSAEIWKNDDVRQVLEERAPEHIEEIKALNLPGFDDLVQSVREDVQIVKNSPLIRKELASRTRGFIYDIKSGKVTLVE